ncbi:MAG: DNA polymerase III subunit alpha [Muribaculaceae bacterium]|nr:DNA polymerase III subunit alpha [Muribaculaceae bacterium]
MQPFVHLHVHSQFSVLDGQASVSALVDKAIADGMRGIALTDHGNMFGIKEFFNYAKKKNSKANDKIKDLTKELKSIEESGDSENIRINEIKEEIAKLKKSLFVPIFGCEMYVCEKSMGEHTHKRDTGRHLVVLAKNSQGYHNLIKLVSMAWTQGFYSHPRIDKENLEKYHEGLIVSSACLGGEIPRLIQEGRIDEAREVIKWFKGIWGEDYYLELQRHKATVLRANHEVYPLQVKVNEVLMQLSAELGVKLICTNDVHFVNEEDAEAHDRLICVATGKYISDENRMLYSKQEWMKSTAEMNELFGDVPDALANTVEILEKVEQYTIDHGPILPNFPLPDGFTDNNDYLRHLVYVGADKRWSEITDDLRERIDFELSTIKNMGFPGYFLIVQDFIQAARELGVSVGPGRGSAAGSAVAYCLGITQIDPIKYDLLFERFLNPDRISLPDIDIDFDDDGRAEVLKYVTDKYGAEKVARIITYGTMATKSAIKDVARVQQLPLPESDRLTKMIPTRPSDLPPQENGKATKITVKNCVKYIPELKAEYNSSDPIISSTLHYAEALEGNVRNTGVHACGVIIGRDDITDWVPVSTAYDKDGEKLLVTQYEGSVIEDTGLIKMDFLGLKTLSIIKEALDNIKLTTGQDIDIEKIDICDPKTYKLYCEGRTTGTFQFESAGMQKYLKALQPSTFEDLIAMNALYRPGPMDYIPQFIARKQGKEPIVYDIPIMEKYLKDTYGITVYQEQVMLLSRLLAGFTRGESDGLRKAMGKKLIDKLASLKPKFIKGGQERGHEPAVLEKIWADWEKFASYAFNKSHATCYSWVAFQTAYLKANYPSEYMAAVLSRNLNDIVTITRFMDECKSMKIEVKGPDVNESFRSFGVNKKGDIRFGLAAIKGVGINTVNAIIDERNENGPYKSIFDFVERVNLSNCNRRAIESLALAGAFDSFEEISREDFFTKNAKDEAFSDILVRYGQRFQIDKDNQENSLFGLDNPIMTAHPVIEKCERWSDVERLERERELVGMYLSAHPLDPFFMELEFGCNTKMSELKDKEELIDEELTFGGIVTDFVVRPTKTGSKFAVMKIEDYSGTSELRLFGQNYIDYAKFGEKGTPIFVKAKYQKNKYKDRVDLQIMSIDLLDAVKGKLIDSILIDLLQSNINLADIDLLKSFLTSGTTNRGTLMFNLKDETLNKSVKLKSRFQIPITRELINFLNEQEITFHIN